MKIRRRHTPNTKKRFTWRFPQEPLTFNQQIDRDTEPRNIELMRIYSMPYGTERRKQLLAWIGKVGKVAVNRRSAITNLKDPDLTKLIKSGKLKKVRKGAISTYTTFLVRA